MMALFSRMLRAAKFDPAVYEEVEADPKATGQAMTVVILSAVAAGLGSLGHPELGGNVGVLITTFSALFSWIFWAYVTYFIGIRFFKEPQTQTDPGELLRTIGFSSAPGVIRILGALPGTTIPVFGIAALWMFIAMIVAVKHSFDFASSWKAAQVVLVGWLIQSLVLTTILIIPVLLKP